MGSGVTAPTFLPSALDGGELLFSSPGQLYSSGKEPLGTQLIGDLVGPGMRLDNVQ
jgi:hypothetical protein